MPNGTDTLVFSSQALSPSASATTSFFQVFLSPNPSSFLLFLLFFSWHDHTEIFSSFLLLMDIWGPFQFGDNMKSCCAYLVLKPHQLLFFMCLSPVILRYLISQQYFTLLKSVCTCFAPRSVQPVLTPTHSTDEAFVSFILR